MSRGATGGDLRAAGRRGRGIGALSISLAVAGALAASTSARGAVVPLLGVSEELLQERVTPAPLVPTYVPPPFAARGVIEPGFARRRVYSLRILRPAPGGIDVIALARCPPHDSTPFGRCTGLAGTRRHYVRNGFRSQPTRVRGTPGFLLVRGPSRLLIWREDGLVHELGSNSPPTVSVRQMRATARGLDRLQHRYVGSGDPDTSSGAVLVAGEHFVAGHVDWHGACNSPDGRGRSGAMDIPAAPRQGSAFTVDIGTSTHPSASGWVGTISGTVGPTAIVLSIRAAGTFAGVTCDTGPLSFTVGTLDRSPFAR